MSEPKKRNLFQRVLDKAIGVKHPDEGMIARDYIPIKGLDEVTPDEARASIRRDQEAAMEQGMYEASMGHRTFPTAVQFPGRTPMMQGAAGIGAKAQREQLSKGRPFFTDPGSGDVDYAASPLPFVFPVPSGARAAAASEDRALWPANVPPETGELSHWITKVLGLKR